MSIKDKLDVLVAIAIHHMPKANVTVSALKQNGVEVVRSEPSQMQPPGPLLPKWEACLYYLRQGLYCNVNQTKAYYLFDQTTDRPRAVHE